MALVKLPNIKIVNKDLIIASLLESLCEAYNNPNYVEICNYLLNNGVINDPKVLEDNNTIKYLYKQFIESLVSRNMLTGGNKLILYNSRYKEDFLEIEKIGAGGFGSVYKSYNKLDQSTYAIKKIKIDKITETNNIYLNEVINLSKLNHENIVRYYNTWIELPILYLQMELCMTTLEKYIISRNYSGITNFDLESLFFKQLVNGLYYIHQNDIIHGDLNPGNIFLTENNVIKIGDFGLSKGCLDNSNISSSYGNLMYMSPEQKNQKICTKKSDVYSLGIIFIDLFLPMRFRK